MWNNKESPLSFLLIEYVCVYCYLKLNKKWNKLDTEHEFFITNDVGMEGVGVSKSFTYIIKSNSSFSTTKTIENLWKIMLLNNSGGIMKNTKMLITKQLLYPPSLALISKGSWAFGKPSPFLDVAFPLDVCKAIGAFTLQAKIVDCSHIPVFSATNSKQDKTPNWKNPPLECFFFFMSAYISQTFAV